MENDVIYCNHCGQKNFKNARYCSKCGQKLRLFESDENKGHAGQEGSDQGHNSHKKTKPIFTIAAIIIIVGLVIAVANLYLSSKTSNTEGSSIESTTSSVCEDVYASISNISDCSASNGTETRAGFKWCFVTANDGSVGQGWIPDECIPEGLSIESSTSSVCEDVYASISSISDCSASNGTETKTGYQWCFISANDGSVGNGWIPDECVP